MGIFVGVLRGAEIGLWGSAFKFKGGGRNLGKRDGGTGVSLGSKTERLRGDFEGCRERG